MLSLNAVGGAWSCPSLMCKNVWTPHGNPYLFGRVDEGWAGMRQGGTGEGELCLEYKTKLRKKKDTDSTEMVKAVNQPDYSKCRES